MRVLGFFSTLVSRRRAPAAVKTAPVAPVAWTPRPAPRSGRQEAPRTRHAAPPPAERTDPPAVKPRPPVPPIGARGETDLSPSRVNLESVTYPSADQSGDGIDRAALRELFTDIARGQAAPVKSFLGDLRAGTATGEWLQICRPVMANLFESATSLGLNDAAPPMNDFISALDRAAESQEAKEGPIDGATRDALLTAYDELMNVFPEVFALGGAVSRRDTMLLHALLKQVQGVGIVTFDALYGVGLTSVEALAQADPSDLSTTTGLAAPLCEAICAVLREHRLEIDRGSHLPPKRRFSERLAELLRALVKEHEAFLRVNEEAGFSDVRAERKRAARRDRNLCALKIEATLIEMGAVECADALRVLSFDRRIDHMEKFLGVRVAKRAAERR